MFRKRRGLWYGGFFKSLFLASLVAGVALNKKLLTFSAAEVFPMKSRAETATSTEQVPDRVVFLLGVPAPSASSDKLFAVTLPSGKATERKVESGWRLARMRTDRLAVHPSGKNDGVFVLADWNVPLRMKNGSPYQEVAYLGMWDPSHAALSAQTSGYALLSVSRLGEIREIYQMPEDANLLGFQDGFAWFATFRPGEGIESPPQGPSDLLRVDAEGKPEVFATAERIIVSVVAGPNGVYAHQTESGDVTAQSGSLSWKGEGRPLLWLDESRLVFAKGTNVKIANLENAGVQDAATLPMAPTVGRLEP